MFVQTKMKRRVLLYNWTQFDDSKGRGGGVSVYLRNIIPEYLRSGAEVVFLSSGCHYSLFKKEVFYRATNNVYSGLGVKSYEIVNSPIKAPSADSFHQIQECLENEEIARIFIEVVESLGKFDEIHFHNIEGISTKTIQQLKQTCNSKLIVWFHNYHWVCPQIELFNRSKSKCIDYKLGAECRQCIGEYRDTKGKIKIQRLVSFLELNRLFRGYFGRWVEGRLSKVFIASRGFIGLLRKAHRNRLLGRYKKIPERRFETEYNLNRVLSESVNYRDWREKNINILNKSVDVCIAVSGLVKRQVVSFGVDHEKVKVVPLAMDVFRDNFIEFGEKKSSQIPSKIRVGFLGYGNVAKGLPFLCAALDDLDIEYKSAFSFHVFSKLDNTQKRALERLASTLDLHIVDGYKRSELESISEMIDVAIVPSVWLETFNQVSYEMVMNGVPVLISDSVGIAEYLPSDFQFKSGDTDSFLELFKKILDKPSELYLFWKKDEIILNSIKDHYVKLYGVLDF